LFNCLADDGASPPAQALPEGGRLVGLDDTIYEWAMTAGSRLDTTTCTRM
jgi:hypothetical protein